MERSKKIKQGRVSTLIKNKTRTTWAPEIKGSPVDRAKKDRPRDESWRGKENKDISFIFRHARLRDGTCTFSEGKFGRMVVSLQKAKVVVSLL